MAMITKPGTPYTVLLLTWGFLVSGHVDLQPNDILGFF